VKHIAGLGLRKGGKQEKYNCIETGGNATIRDLLDDKKNADLRML
jgi:hypothetical protein